MEIDELRGKANEHGLVPMRVTRSFTPYIEGEVAGFPPDVAYTHILNGQAEVFSETPKQAKAREDAARAAANGPAFIQDQHLGSPRAHPYDRRPEVSPNAQVAKGPTGLPDGLLLQADDIPEGWADWPASERRKLAANLSQTRYQEISGDHANEIIQAAIDGRVPPAPPGSGTMAPVDVEPVSAAAPATAAEPRAGAKKRSGD